MFAPFHFSLKAYDVVKRAEGVVLAELDDGVGLFVFAFVRVGEADGFHGAEAQSFRTAGGHDFDGHAAVEIGGVFFLFGQSF